MYNLPTTTDIASTLTLVNGEVYLYAGVRQDVLATLTGRVALTTSAREHYNRTFDSAVNAIVANYNGGV